jgi:DNA modification methylase
MGRIKVINEIHNENCLETMKKMPGEFIDLTVTSPPYDDLREYEGYSFDFEPTAKMAALHGRNYIGSEISERYCHITRERIPQVLL